MSTVIRTARADELDGVMALHRHLNPDDDCSDPRRLAESWNLFQSSGNICRCLVAEEDGIPAASCCLYLLPNLTRGGRPIAFIENVVTRPDRRRKGLALMLMREAIDTAWRNDCYKIVLQSNRKRVEAHGLYEKLGFVKDGKYAYELRRA
jgi:GNAT superfamily N-acetyltransferase